MSKFSEKNLRPPPIIPGTLESRKNPLSLNSKRRAIALRCTQQNESLAIRNIMQNFRFGQMSMNASMLLA